jgi:hypothetical protein
MASDTRTLAGNARTHRCLLAWLCLKGRAMTDAQQMRNAANDAAYWIVEIMRGSNRDTRYTQAVMEKAREHIQRLALLLHDAVAARRVVELASGVALPSTAAAMAAEYQAWIDFFHAGKGDYDDFLKRLPANHSGVKGLGE